MDKVFIDLQLVQFIILKKMHQVEWGSGGFEFHKFDQLVHFFGFMIFHSSFIMLFYVIRAMENLQQTLLCPLYKLLICLI